MGGEFPSPRAPMGKTGWLKITRWVKRPGGQRVAHGTCQAWLSAELVHTASSTLLTNTGPGAGWGWGGAEAQFAHRDQETVQVPGLGGALGLGRLAQQLCQALHSRHPHDVDVIVAAEGLNEREVDLQGDVVLLLLVDGQEAQDHAVGIPEGTEGDGWISWGLGRAPLPVRRGVCKSREQLQVCRGWRLQADGGVGEKMLGSKAGGGGG